MPMFIPVIGALFTGGGLFAAGGAIAGGIGTFLGGSAIAGFIGAGIAGALGGALVGAAMGGLTSLVTGGDIGKGMLYGAIGGAVTGALGGVLDQAGFLSGAVDLEQSTSLANYSRDGYTATSTGQAAYAGPSFESAAIQKGTEQAVEKGLMAKLSGEAQGALVEGAFKLGGGMLQGVGEQKRFEAQMEIEMAEAQKNREFEMEKLKMQLSANARGGGGGSAPSRDWAAELAEQRRQFNAEMDQRKQEHADLLGVRKEELYAPMEYQDKMVQERSEAVVNAGTIARGGETDFEGVLPQLQAQNNPQPQGA